MILTTRNFWWIKKKSIKYRWNLQVFLKNSGNKVLIFIGAITIWFFDNFTTTWAEISEPSVVWRLGFFGHCFKRWPWNCSDFSVKQPGVCHLLQWKSRNFWPNLGITRLFVYRVWPCLTHLIFDEEELSQRTIEKQIIIYMFFSSKVKGSFFVTIVIV